MKYNKEIDKFVDECGVFGIRSNDDTMDVARLTYYALYALQHRGQESAGIAVNDKETIIHHKDTGLVPEVFNDIVLNHLKGSAAIGHVRYAASGGNQRENVQPMIVRYKSGQIALAYNGNLVNSAEMREKMEEYGAVFQSSSDTEVMANLISRYRIASNNIEETLVKMMGDIKGSYAIVIMTPRKMIGIRDPLGMRPLCIGRLSGSYIFASESCALDAIEADFIRDLEPGEIVVIDNDGVKSIQTAGAVKSHLCVFEFVYFARPDSIIDHISVHSARMEAGRELAREYPADADLVIGAPDGGLNAALGFSRESGLPYGQGLLKNKYVGRTFIQPEQGQRDMGVRIKFNAMRNEVEGKRVVMVDDSIVRGTTTKRIVQMIKNAGAREVHIRISSPPYRFPCFFEISGTVRAITSSSLIFLEITSGEAFL
jgi:amidophosphoribosyltransferase